MPCHDVRALDGIAHTCTIGQLYQGAILRQRQRKHDFDSERCGHDQFCPYSRSARFTNASMKLLAM